VKQSSSEPSPRTGPPGQQPGQSRTIRRSADTPKRYERAVGQAAGPVSNRNDIRKPSGMLPGMRRTIRRSADPPKRHQRAVGQAAGPVSNRNDIHKPSGTPPDMRQTIHRRDPPREPLGKLPSARAGGQLQYRTEPPRLFAVNPLMVGELGRRVIGEVILV